MSGYNNSGYQQDMFGGIDTRDTQPIDPNGGSYRIYPEGDYPAVIANMEKKENKRRDGAYVEVTYQFISGEFAGGEYISRMNLWNPNQQAVDIAKRELASLRLALGLPSNEGSPAAFIGKTVTLSLKLSSKDGKDNNNVKAISPGASSATATGQQVQPQSSTQTFVTPNAPAASFQTGHQGPQTVYQPNTAGRTDPWKANVRR